MLGQCLAAQERYEEAEPHLEKAVKLLVEQLGQENPVTQVAILSYLEVLEKLGNFSPEGKAELERVKAKAAQDADPDPSP